jgi:hypothetical protein
MLGSPCQSKICVYDIKITIWFDLKIWGDPVRRENNSPGSSQNMTPEWSPSMQDRCRIAWLCISASQARPCQTSKSLTLHRSVSSTTSSTPNEIPCSVPDLEPGLSCLTLCSVSFALSFLWAVSSLINDARNLVESSLAGTVSTRGKTIEFILSFSFVVSRSLSLGSIEAEATSKWTIQHGSWFILY